MIIEIKFANSLGVVGCESWIR